MSHTGAEETIRSLEAGRSELQPGGAPDQPGAAPRKGAFARVLDALEGYPLFVVLALVIIVFSLLEPESFPTWGNVTSLLQNEAVLILVAFAATFPLAAGEFDLSVAVTMELSSLVAAKLMTTGGMDVLPAALIAVGLGVAVGGLNGFLVCVMRVPAFVATLGVSTILAGVALAVSESQTLTGFPESLISFGRTELFGGMPIVVLYIAVASLLLGWLLQRTAYGRYLFAIGANREAVRRMGISVDWYVALSFVVAGAIAGIGGVIYAGQVGAATPGIGNQFLLPAYAAVFLGAAAFRSRQFSIPGTLVAAILVSATVTGLLQVGVPDWFNQVFNGGILILAVIWSLYIGNRRRQA
jgi:ribose transport system permease protein